MPDEPILFPPGGNAVVTDNAIATLVKTGTLTNPALNSLYANAVHLSKYIVNGNITGAGAVAAAFVAAAIEAGKGGTIFVPRYLGTYVLDTPIVLDQINLISDGAVITTTAAVGANKAAIEMASSTGEVLWNIISGFTLVGDGAYQLGVKTSNVSGIKFTGASFATARDVTVKNYGYGFDLANDVGHIKFNNVVATNNYYGVYCSKNTYDYNFSNGCLINGNTFANFATPADQGFGSLSLIDCHIGFAPYGIYQEPTPAAQGANALFLQDCILNGARFEQIGNGAIVTDATQGNPTNRSLSGDIFIRHPGFSWSPASGAGSYRIPGRNRDYAVVFSQTTRVIEIVAGTAPFTAGDLNTYRIKLQGHDAFILRGATSQTALSQITIDVITTAANIINITLPLRSGSDMQPTFGGLDITAGSGYIRWSGNATRSGGDGTTLYHDSANVSWRDSSNGYAQVASLTPNGFSVAANKVMRTGASNTRPSAAVGNGSMYYDTTLNKPIWSDGTNWRDATGTVV